MKASVVCLLDLLIPDRQHLLFNTGDDGRSERGGLVLDDGKYVIENSDYCHKYSECTRVWKLGALSLGR